MKILRILLTMYFAAAALAISIAIAYSLISYAVSVDSKRESREKR